MEKNRIPGDVVHSLIDTAREYETEELHLIGSLLLNINKRGEKKKKDCNLL
ncbi:hypothetical protein ACOSQ2_008906 [Xanthoceras sorbifolium]